MESIRMPRSIRVSGSGASESFEAIPEAVGFIAERNMNSWSVVVPSELDVTATLEGARPNQTAIVSLWGKEVRIPRQFGDSEEGLSLSADPNTDEVYSFNLSVLPINDLAFNRGLCWLYPEGPQTRLSFEINKDQPYGAEELQERVDSFMQRSGRILIDLSRGEV